MSSITELKKVAEAQLEAYHATNREIKRSIDKLKKEQSK